MKKILWILVIALAIPIVGASWTEWSPWQTFTYERTNYNFSIDVSEKWNMISIPWNESISKDDLTIVYDDSYTWDEAVDAGLLLNFIYGWDTENQYYEFVDVLEPDRGYWLWSYHDITIKG